MNTRSTILVVLALTTAASAYAQGECLTTLQNCSICIAATGTTWNCEEGATGDRIPPELLKDPDLESDDLDPLQAFYGQLVMAHWEDILLPLVDQPNRIYLPRELYRASKNHPNAPGAELRRRSVVRLQQYLIDRASRTRVEKVATGDGGSTFELRATDPLVSYIASLFRRADAWTQEELAEFYEERPTSLMAEQVLPDPVFQLFLMSLEGE